MIDPPRVSLHYRLAWPAELLTNELQRLIAEGSGFNPTAGVSETVARATHLLAEAFVTDEPRRDLISVIGNQTQFTWDDEPSIVPILVFLRELAQTVPELPVGRRLYYSERNVPPTAPSPTTDPGLSLRHGWAEVVTDLDIRGYFDQAAGSLCPDVGELESRQSTMAHTLGAVIRRTLPWPPSRESVEDLDDETLFTAMEILVDHVARPRSTTWHDFYKHEDYEDFDHLSGQDVYLWKLNELLGRCAPGYRMVDQGPHRGEIVTTTTDGREGLVSAALAHTSATAGNLDRVQHAVERFRARGASVEDKRSAVKALGDVLEHRRDLLKSTLTKSDAGALFDALNNFGIRHHAADQQTNYPQEEFLDWIFWNALSTVELTNRLLADPAEDPDE